MACLQAQAQAQAQADAVQRCQALEAAQARLLCYDALFPPKLPSALTSASAAPSVNQPAAAVAAVAAQERAARFGLPQSALGAELEQVESAVYPDFDGWGPNDKIRLQNGQVWEVVDGSSGNAPTRSSKVWVRRGALGSFFLEFDGLTKSPRVRRLK